MFFVQYPYELVYNREIAEYVLKNLVVVYWVQYYRK